MYLYRGVYLSPILCYYYACEFREYYTDYALKTFS